MAIFEEIETLPDLEAMLDNFHDPEPGKFTPVDLRTAMEEARQWSPHWLVKSLWMGGSHGQLAGAAKSGKSYLGLALAVGVASGVPVLGTFEVPEQLPVLAYVGEGGLNPFLLRLERMASAHGIDDVGDLPFHPVQATAPVTSPEFQAGLRDNLERYRPGLVWLDPLYSYFEPGLNAASLFDMGRMLNAVSGPCNEASAALIINNHFNQTGSGTNLQRISWAGAAEQVDSWLLVDHREKYDKATGTFKMRVEAGARQGSSTEWDIDLSIGSFDPDTVRHSGEIAWTVSASDGSPTGKTNKREKIQEVKMRIVEVVRDSDEPLTKTDLRPKVGGRFEDFTEAINGLIDDGILEVTSMKGKTRTRRVVKLGLGYDLMMGELE